MAELSESKLLLLSNLMYYEGKRYKEQTVESLAEAMQNDANKGDKSMFSGGMTPGEAKSIALAIRSDPQLKSLTISSSIKDDNQPVSAACFYDADGEAIIAVRGTGGSYPAWDDNVQGAINPNTACQEALRDFVHEAGKTHNNITITGHSKGGNMAMYATIKEGDVIDRCVSFDGQGFNKDFLYDSKGNLRTEVSENGGKITSICGDDDVVSNLLNPVPGETRKHLDVDPGIPEGHSSVLLWQKNNGKTDANGDFNETVDQAEMSRIVGDVANQLVEDIHKAPKFAQPILIDAAGAMIGAFLALTSHQLTLDNVKDAIWKALKAAGLGALTPASWLIIDLEIKKLAALFLAELALAGIISITDAWSTAAKRSAANARGSRRATGDHKRRMVSAHSAGSKPANIDINIATVKAACGELVTIGSNLDSIQGEIAELTGELLVEDSVNAILKQKLSQISRGLGKDAKRINKIGEAGAQCMELYASTESSIAGMK